MKSWTTSSSLIGPPHEWCNEYQQTPVPRDRLTSVHPASRQLKEVAPDGLGLRRWRYRAEADGLVHSMLAQHGVRFWELDGAVIPGQGVTECGVPTLLIIEDITAHYFNGAIVDEPLTCITCASGRALAGMMLRQEQKQRNFGQMYGISGRTPSNWTPPLHQMLRSRR